MKHAIVARTITALTFTAVCFVSVLCVHVALVSPAAGSMLILFMPYTILISSAVICGSTLGSTVLTAPALPGMRKTALHAIVTVSAIIVLTASVFAIMEYVVSLTTDHQLARMSFSVNFILLSIREIADDLLSSVLYITAAAGLPLFVFGIIANLMLRWFRHHKETFRTTIHPGLPAA